MFRGVGLLILCLLPPFLYVYEWHSIEYHLSLLHIEHLPQLLRHYAVDLTQHHIETLPHEHSGVLLYAQPHVLALVLVIHQGFHTRRGEFIAVLPPLHHEVLE